MSVKLAYKNIMSATRQKQHWLSLIALIALWGWQVFRTYSNKFLEICDNYHLQLSPIGEAMTKGMLYSSMSLEWLPLTTCQIFLGHATTIRPSWLLRILEFVLVESVTALSSSLHENGFGLQSKNSTWNSTWQGWIVLTGVVGSFFVWRLA